MKLKKRAGNESVISFFPFLHWLSLFKITISKWDLPDTTSTDERQGTQGEAQPHLAVAVSQTLSSCSPGHRGTTGDQPHLSPLFLGCLTSQPQIVTELCCEQDTVKHFWELKAEETVFPRISVLRPNITNKYSPKPSTFQKINTGALLHCDTQRAEVPNSQWNQWELGD